jgi:hypothetical protein
MRLASAINSRNCVVAPPPRGTTLVESSSVRAVAGVTSPPTSDTVSVRLSTVSSAELAERRDVIWIGRNRDLEVEVPVADDGVVVRAGVLLWIVAVAVDEAADDARGSSDDRREVVGAEIDAVDASTRFLARAA